MNDIFRDTASDDVDKRLSVLWGLFIGYLVQDFQFLSRELINAISGLILLHSTGYSCDSMAVLLMSVDGSFIKKGALDMMISFCQGLSYWIDPSVGVWQIGAASVAKHKAL